jgi:hypothetical protein
MNYVCGVVDGETQVANMRAMMWQTEPPTQEGWYWSYNSNSTLLNEEPKAVFVYSDKWQHDGALIVYDGGAYRVKNYATHWLGPIPAPEPPKE